MPNPSITYVRRVSVKTSVKGHLPGFGLPNQFLALTGCLTETRHTYIIDGLGTFDIFQFYFPIFCGRG